MDNNKVKDLAQKFGVLLVMNGDEPDFVVMDYKKYLEMEGSTGDMTMKKQDLPISRPAQGSVSTEMPSAPDMSSNTHNHDDATLIDTLNKEIQALNDEIKGQMDSDTTKEV